MSNEAYVNHILQKHHLAISLEVIKTKPENITLDEHIQNLRNMIKKNDMDEDNHSICSDDFFIDETNDIYMNFDETNEIEKTVDENDDNNDRNDHISSRRTDKNYDCTANVQEIVNTQDMNTYIHENIDKTFLSKVPESENNENDRQTEMNDVETIETRNLNDSITILENFDVANELGEINDAVMKGSSLDDVMEILRGTDDGMTTIEKAVSNVTPSKLTQETLLTQPSERIDDTQCFTDFDATQCESLDIAEAVDEHKASQKRSYDLNENQSFKSTKEDKTDKRTKAVVDFVKTNVKKRQEINKNVRCNISKTNVEIPSQKKWKENCLDYENKLKNTEKGTEKLKDYRHLKVYKNIYKNVADIFNSKKIEINEDVQANNSDGPKTLDETEDVREKSYKTNIFEKTDEEILQDVNTQLIYEHNTENFTCKTHYSQSQINDIILEGKFIHGIKRNINEPNKLENEKKKKKEGVFILEDEINSKRHISITKNVSNDDNICLPEIHLTKVTKNADIDLDLKSDQEKLIKKTKKTANDIQPESQMTNYSNSTYSSSTFNQNASEKIKNHNVVSNAVYVSNYNLNAKNSMSDAKDSMLYAANNISLNADKDNLNAKNSMLVTNNNTQNANDILLKADAVKQNAKNNTLYANDDMLNANNITLNVNNLNEVIPNPDSTLNADTDQNDRRKIKHIDKNLFSEESLTNFTYATEAFENISDNSFGFSQYFGSIETINFKASNIENHSTSRAVFDDNLDNTPTNLNTNFENSQNAKADAKNKINDTPKKQKSCGNFDDSKSVEVPEHFNTEIEHQNMATEGCTISDDNEELTDSQVEKVPFKIIEELNKVKIFLNKRNERNSSCKGYSGDTGYRSDTNSRNSLKLSQSCSSGLDQSAHSLYKYIRESPLVASSQDITEEISLVLGQLTDKLHQEERYPSFLEDMLQSIQQMLETIYEDSDDENMLTRKDESIHRIILLNKSIHIQKYTIEKITHTLESLHTQLTTNESFEIQNIHQIENTSYIFHLLEIILQKYNRTSQNLNQDTQNLTQSTQNSSQNTQEDEKSLKKSNIMDIWRKKWNPNYKEIDLEGSPEKKCVIDNCNTVLNKLIVGCMEGYSLISYSALKCFNVMQT